MLSSTCGMSVDRTRSGRCGGITSLVRPTYSGLISTGHLRRWRTFEMERVLTVAIWNRHTRSHFRYRLLRSRPDRRGKAGTAQNHQRSRDEGFSVIGLRKQAGYQRRYFYTCKSHPLSNYVDKRTAMKPQEVTDALKLSQLKDKIWYVVPSCATTGEGLLEGLVCP